MTALTSQQKRIAKRVAKAIISDPTPTWQDVGEDKRNEMLVHFLRRLRETDNKTIAKIIKEHPDLGFAVL